MRTLQCLLFLTGLAAFPAAAEDLKFETGERQLTATLNGQAIFTYVWEDDEVLRPHFRDVFAPDGTRITRSYPPDPERDKGNDDHATFHPGIWLAFGDIGGVDVWRMKGRVRHIEFVLEPDVRAGIGSFTIRNRYEALDDPPRLVAEETCRVGVHPTTQGYYVGLRSHFTPLDPGAAFGDQEEMGLGIRLDTPLAVRQGGSIENNTGGKDESGTWGRAAAWCVAERIQGDTRAGVLLGPSPNNFRPSWFHNRDYGLIVANPFGKKAMTAPNDDGVAPDSTPIPAEGVTLTFGIYIFSEPATTPRDYDERWLDLALLYFSNCFY